MIRKSIRNFEKYNKMIKKLKNEFIILKTFEFVYMFIINNFFIFKYCHFKMK